MSLDRITVVNLPISRRAERAIARVLKGDKEGTGYDEDDGKIRDDILRFVLQLARDRRAGCRRYRRDHRSALPAPHSALN